MSGSPPRAALLNRFCVFCALEFRTRLSGQSANWKLAAFKLVDQTRPSFDTVIDSSDGCPQCSVIVRDPPTSATLYARSQLTCPTRSVKREIC